MIITILQNSLRENRGEGNGGNLGSENWGRMNSGLGSGGVVNQGRHGERLKSRRKGVVV